MITEGFYYCKSSVYYGDYDENQTSGKLRVSAVKPEQILTEHPIRGGEWAVMLWDNHRLLNPEYENFKELLSKMSGLIGLNAGNNADFPAVEKRLGITLPRELRAVYAAVPDGSVYFTGEERFLTPEELYIEDGNIVFYKRKRSPAAGYDIKSGCLSRYIKREWSADPGDVCCYQFCAGRIFTAALMNKPSVRKGRCKGRLVTALNIQKELESLCTGKYHLLSGLDIYGTAAIYSYDGLLAWIRGNGIYADIHAGAPDEAALDELGKLLVDVTWKQ